MQHEVVYLDGRKVDWNKPPKPNTKMKWTKTTMYGRPVYGSFRSVAWLNRMNNLSLKRFGVGIVVIQSAYNTTIEASEGTHDFDACFDVYIPGVDFWTQQKFFRSGGGGAYYRRPSQGFSNHIHLFVLPPREGRSISDDYKVHGFKVGKYVDGGFSTYGRQITSSQLEDYYEHRSALSGHAHDPSWFPPDIAATIFDLNKYVARRRRRQNRQRR